MTVTISEETVRAHCLQYFGFQVERVKSLGSCQDINFRVDLTNNGLSYVIKYANPETKLEELDFQIKVLRFLHANSEGRTELHFPCPTPLVSQLQPTAEQAAEHPATSFITQVKIPHNDGGNDTHSTFYLYALTYLHGTLLSDYKVYLSHDTLLHFGKEIARFNQILADFPTQEIVKRECEWDPKLVYQMCSQRIHVLKNECERYEILSYLEEMQSLLKPFLATLREQLVHCDLAHYNVIAKRHENGRPYVEGIIDFGDISPTWLVGDLAIAITPLLIHNDRDILDYVMSIVQGYHSITPLKEEEIVCLWPLIVMRSILLYISISYLLQENPLNSYLQDEVSLNLEVMQKCLSINPNLAEAAIRRAIGNQSVAKDILQTPLFAHRSQNKTPLSIKYVDMSVFSEIYEAGNWLTPSSFAFGANGSMKSNAGSAKMKQIAVTEKMIDRALTQAIELNRFESAAFVIPPGKAWFVRANVRSLTAPKTVPTFALSFLPKGSQFLAPFDCVVRCLDANDFVQAHWKRSDLPQSVFGDEQTDLHDLHLIEIKSIEADDDRVILIAGDFVVTTESKVAKGQSFATVGAEGGEGPCQGLHAIFTQGYRSSLARSLPHFLTRSLTASHRIPPLFTTGSHWDIWTHFVFDATGSLDLSLTTSWSMNDAILAQRYHYVAACQEHYYGNSKASRCDVPKRPPQIERAYRQWMYDTHGRGYLDTVNNVAVVGHSHPALAKVAYQQLSILNTNSRFIYSALGKFAEEIVRTCVPKHLVEQGKLNRVIFVNSGSEATDLALRIARTVVTERRLKAQANQQSEAQSSQQQTHYGVYRDVICVQGGYHGITTASDEVSTTLNDNPRSLETRAPWIHLVPMPNPYRGIHLAHGLTSDSSDEEISTFYADYVKRKVEELSAAGHPPSAFIAEPLEGNAGGVELPPGYLQQVYTHIRSAGGLCICDEVQVGYGRLGNHFWGFEEHGIEPDIVTMAKASGNGHPLGFVLLSHRLVEEFGEAQGSFFSSAGGGPVGCMLGEKILHIIQEEALQENAKEVGLYMKEKLEEVRERHPDIIGYIHGHGLYQGIELVRNYRNKNKGDKGEGESKGFVAPEPATREAYAICERMLELGAICHNTGDYSNVLKMKPPLCITKEDADYFAEALDIACSGW